MNRNSACAVAVAWLALPYASPGHATGASFVDAFYVAHARLESDNVDFDDGDGYGFK